jgi:hypothetical protein
MKTKANLPLSIVLNPKRRLKYCLTAKWPVEWYAHHVDRLKQFFEEKYVAVLDLGKDFGPLNKKQKLPAVSFG